MKRILFLIVAFFSITVYSQVAVVDIGANKQLSKQILESIKQTQQMEQNLKLMKEAKEKYEKINGYIQQMGHLQNIINEQKAAINNANKINVIVGKKRIKADLKGVQYNLQVISGCVKTVQAILKNGIFNLQDGERIRLMEDQYQKVKSANTNIKVQLVQYSF